MKPEAKGGLKMTVAKRHIVLIMMIAVALFCALVLTQTPSHAATKPTKVYDQVIKSGDYAYCIAGTGIYKVNVKSGKIKKLVKDPGDYGHYRQMCKKGKYLYYIKGGTDVRGDLYRVSIKGGKSKHLAGNVNKARCVSKYMIKKDRIYYKEMNATNGKEKTKKMKLNGKAKKKSKAKVKWSQEESNKSGYYIDVNVYDAPSGSGYYEMIQYYLETPNGHYYYLGTKGFH